jgi:hypothetical protein
MFGYQHPEWASFERAVRQQIDQHVSQLENVSLDIDKTNFTRGQIAALRKILAEGRPPTPQPSPERGSPATY